ncbi:MAG TPA: hypothetical protein VH592_23855 [Gemmataceae bacterium]
MIPHRLPLISLVAILTLTSTAKSVNREKLRTAINLPEVISGFGYGANGWGELLSTADTVPQPEKIAEIEAQLKGDVTDAERYCRLNSLYYRANQPAKGNEQLRKAEALLRRHLKSHPDDKGARLRLADVLDGLQIREEVETLLRRAVADSAKDWQAWLALGRFLSGKSRRTILNGKTIHGFTAEEIAHELQKISPTPEQIAAGQQLAKEADACLNRAVELAPRTPKVYFDRGMAHFDHDSFYCGLRIYMGDKVGSDGVVPSPEARRDLRKAVTLGFSDYGLIGLVDVMDAMADAYEYSLSNPSAGEQKHLQDSMSEATRQRVREHVALLTREMRQDDKRKAAEAAEILGYLQLLIIPDVPAAKQVLRRSIDLDPSRNAPWEMLLFILLREKQLQKAEELCCQRLKHCNTARNRLFLARVYVELDRLPKAEEVIRAGLDREPDDFLLNLSYADLLLMRGGNDELKQATEVLGKLEKGRSQAIADDRIWPNYCFACGISYGLSGDIDLARRWLEDVRKRKPKYPHLQEVLKALVE